MKTFLVFLIPVLLILIISCNTPRYIYSTTTQNLPSLKKKGDFQVDGFYSTNGDNATVSDSVRYHNGADFNAAVAISNHWAITGSLGYRWEKESYNENYLFGGALQTISTVKYKRMNWEIGGGYYTSIHRLDKVYLQLFGGVGAGKYEMQERGELYDYSTVPAGTTSITRFHNNNVFRFYLHPAIHFHFNRYFKMAVAAKFLNVHYSDIKTNYLQPELESYRLTPLEGKTFSFFEPCVDLKFNIPNAEWVAPHMQFSVSTPLSSYDTRKFNASFGITFRIPDREPRD